MRSTLVSMMMATALLTGSARAMTPRVTVEHGIEFVTIGDPGNEPLPPDLVVGLYPSPAGRGSVNYEYRLARSEISTTEWVEFMDAMARVAPEFTRETLEPFSFGGLQDATWSGPGDKWYVVPGYERTPVLGISWRSAAMYCNWLHNDKGPTIAALMDGAYDVSTFTSNPDGSFNDQLNHSPEAKYWIPTLDEWLKAAHYDPQRYGEGQAGWWLYPYASDEAPASGWPGELGAETSRGAPDLFDDEGYITRIPELHIPVGAYTDANGPWGLLDVSGGAGEWLEEADLFGGLAYSRFGAGSWVGAGGDEYWDRVGTLGGGGTPDQWAPFMGLRLASAPVPCPSVLPALIMIQAWRRHKRPS